jgi:hypothetical protein
MKRKHLLIGPAKKLAPTPEGSPHDTSHTHSAESRDNKNAHARRGDHIPGAS